MLIFNGWDWENRPLTDQQMRNVVKLVKYPAGASFSVPGAGKLLKPLHFTL